jgi:hypothetical protein
MLIGACGCDKCTSYYKAQDRLYKESQSYKNVMKYNKKLENKYNHSKLYCAIMTIIDFRFWFCDCGYWSPYGKVISAECKKHD